ncbi:MAG: hypothetical protein NTW96_25235 [Planctomycetia bacterium]|nr:hypothetical protein [Planctomycetia bacterium]
MSFRRVKPGDPVKIPAPAYNAWCDAAEAFRAGNQGFTTPTAGDRPDYTRVKVRNDSGADRSRFDVLGVSGPLFTPTENLAEFLRAPKLIGALPDADTHAGRFVILLEPLPAGKIGWALAAGVVPVTVNMVTADDKFADVTDAQAGYLTSGAEGAARILWADTGTGQKRAVVLLGATGGALQYKTTPALVFVVGDEDAEWADVAGQASIATQTVVTGFQVSGLALQTKTRSIYADPAGDETEFNTVHTGTDDCPEA